MLLMKIWMLRRQTAIYFILIIFLFLITGFYEVYTRNSFTFSWVLLQILGLVLAVYCIRFILASRWYMKHDRIRRRILTEYTRMVFRQHYKISRLSELESEILKYIQHHLSLEEIISRTGLTHHRLFAHIINIQQKLEIAPEEGLLEFNLADEIL